jgi:hypothetical protein
MPDELPLPEMAGEIVKKTLESKPVDNLLSPITREVGLALGDIGSVLRFYMKENLEGVFRKWAEQRHGVPIRVSEIRIVVRLLQSASQEANDEMQARWAALLESTVAEEGEILPSFGRTLIRTYSRRGQVYRSTLEICHSAVPAQVGAIRKRAL